MARKYLEAQPDILLGAGRYYLFVEQSGGWQGHICGLDWKDGVANGGGPINEAAVMKARACGALFSWWEYQPDIKVEFPPNAPPVAYVEVADEPKPKDESKPKPKAEAEAKPKRKRGRPKKVKPK